MPTPRSLAAILCLAAAALHAQPKPADWQSLFDGRTLQGWTETPFTGRGQVRVENQTIILDAGAPLTGITWKSGQSAFSPFSSPKTPPASPTNYELRFQAARLKGGDFFASVTFPVGDSHCTWVTGGWGGDIVGLSSIDGWDASDNETRSYFNFDTGRWYAFRLQVTPDRIQAWIDDRAVVNLALAGHTLTLRHGEIQLSAPLGFASYNTTGALRKIEYRRLR
jgi:hypothetical protein